jgi:segregation and condensation protein B
MTPKWTTAMDDPDTAPPAIATDAPRPHDQPQLFAALPLAEQERMLEAILFASADPLTRTELERRMPTGCDIPEALVVLERRYQGRGVRLVRVGDAWAFRTAPDLGHLMHQEVIEMRKLSRAAIETLAIIAYHQPVTRAEIEEIRGVAVSRGTLDQLLELEWIRLGRRRMTPGRPVTFVVTDGFLDHFGLASSRDLPGIADLRAAGLLDNRPLPGFGAPDPDEDGDDAPPADDQADLFEG